MFGLVSNAIKIGKSPRVVGGKNCERFSEKRFDNNFGFKCSEKKRHVNILPKKITLILAMSNIYGIFWKRSMLYKLRE